MTALTGKDRRAAGPLPPCAPRSRPCWRSRSSRRPGRTGLPSPALAVETSKESFEAKYKDDYHQAIKDRKKDPSITTNTMWTDDDL